MDEKALFLELLEINSPSEREARLAAATQGNEALRRNVEELLKLHEKTGDFLQGSPAAVLQTIAHVPGESPGMQIGPYKLLEQIGEGGMGTVWMAQQQEPIQRLVAVKLIKAGMDSKQVIARFEAERQALALMDHPNIAKVLDGGTTGSEPGGVSPGRPYFVMDLVKGVPITKYCDEHHLTPRQRLELFLPVCHAIQHAHQKGIIHRDLKPSNVLVAPYDGKPVPKVIDFGVAKATGQSLTDKTLVTGFGSIVGTVEYMSPEQAEINQLDIDTRSDIYSLGVLLYELLAGTPPFSRKDLEKTGMLEMLRVIREQEPSKPSTKLSTAEGLPTLAANRGTEPAKLTRLIRGELDWIVMKALEKDRNRRYETASGFAMDVQRYLNDEAVQACPPSVGYRLRKFARRNKSGLAMAALVLFFLVLLCSGAGWEWRDRTARAAEAAQQQAARQARVAGQVNSIFVEVDRLEQEQKWPEALTAARRAEAAVAGGEADAPTTERVRARLKDLVFIDRLEKCRMQAATLVGGKLDYVGANREYAQAFGDYGVDIDDLAVEQSIDRLKARPALAIPLAAALDGWATAQANVFNRDATRWKRLVAVARGIDPEPVRDLLRAALLKPGPEVRTELRRLANSIVVRRTHQTTIVILADRLMRTEQADAALRLLRDAHYAYPGDFWVNYSLGNLLLKHNDHEEAIRFLATAVGIRPNAAEAHDDLGCALTDQKKLDEAIACFRKAIELDPKYAAANNNLGNALSRQGKPDEAIDAYRKAIELDPKYAIANCNLGIALSEQKKLDEAIACFRKAIELDPKFAVAYGSLGSALNEQNKLDEAIACVRKAIELNPNDADFRINLGLALKTQGRLDEAIAAYRKAIELNPNFALVHNALGVALKAQGRLDEAIAAYRKAIELDPKYAIANCNLGIALSRQGKLGEAIDAYRKAIELDPKYVIAISNLGSALADQKKLNVAIDAYRKATELDPKNADIRFNLGVTLLEQGTLVEAIAAFRKVIELDPKYARAYYSLGSALSTQGKLDEAIVAYRKAIELDPKYAIANNNLGIALSAQGKLDGAIAAFRKAIELDPKYAIANCNLGTALKAQGKLDEAIAAFRKAIELDPTNADARFSLGTALHLQSKWEEAIAAYRKTIELDAKYPNARIGLAEVLANLAWTLATDPLPGRRDPGRAVKLAKEAVELKPRESAIWNTLGVAQYRAGKWKDAIAALEKSMELRNGGDGFDWFILAMARGQLGEKDKAREWYDKAATWMDKNAPKNEELLRFRAESAELLGLKEKK
jgi:tetratricopeptide (TPR) repeat protein/serine/threonine protein kinase